MDVIPLSTPVQKYLHGDGTDTGTACDYARPDRQVNRDGSEGPEDPVGPRGCQRQRQRWSWGSERAQPLQERQVKRDGDDSVDHHRCHVHRVSNPWHDLPAVPADSHDGRLR